MDQKNRTMVRNVPLKLRVGSLPTVFLQLPGHSPEMTRKVGPGAVLLREESLYWTLSEHTAAFVFVVVRRVGKRALQIQAGGERG